MAEGREDTPGAGAGAGPDGGATPAVGTTDAGSPPAPQAAAGAEPQAPAQPGTTDGGLVEIGGQPQEPQPAGGGQAGQAQPGGQPADPRALQARYDAVAQQRNLAREAHPDEYDAQGNFVGPQGAGAQPALTEIGGQQQQPGQWGGAQPGQPGQPAPQAPPATSVQEATMRGLNEHVAGMLYGDNPVGAVQAALQILAETGGIPQGLVPQAAGQPGPTPEQVQAVAAQTYQQHAQQERQFGQQVESIEAEFGDAFLGQQFALDGQKTSLGEALPELCARAGTTNPLYALEHHPHLAPQIRALREQAMRERIQAEMLAQGMGGQVPPGGGGLGPAGVAAEGSTIASIGGGEEPLKR